MHWAWNLAYEPLMQSRHLLSLAAADNLNAWRSDADAFLAIPIERFDYRAARDRAADAGTIAHEMVEDFIRGRDIDASKHPAELVALATPAYEAFREWADSSKLQTIETEVPLVSETHRFGGTRDAIMVNGKRACGDWKTSNAIYPEYLLQLAGYGVLDEEAGNVLDGGFHLLKFSKQEKPTDPVRFAHFYWSQLDLAKTAFLRMVVLYREMQEIAKLVK